MRKLVVFLSAISICSSALADGQAFSINGCLIFESLKGPKIEKRYGRYCAERQSPGSTFKIPLSLMGYDSKILIDENTPVFEYKPTYSKYIDGWEQDHTPKSWMKLSVVWYSQLLTPQIGLSKIQSYLKDFKYGNKNMSGTKEKPGITWAWLGNTLKISPKEQSEFIENMYHKKFKLSDTVYEMTKNITYRETLDNGWNLYGKTGTPFGSDQIQTGWFIGYAEKDDRAYSIVINLKDTKKEKTYAGPRAFAIAKEYLLQHLD